MPRYADYFLLGKNFLVLRANLTKNFCFSHYTLTLPVTLSLNSLYRRIISLTDRSIHRGTEFVN